MIGIKRVPMWSRTYNPIESRMLFGTMQAAASGRACKTSDKRLALRHSAFWTKPRCCVSFFNATGRLPVHNRLHGSQAAFSQPRPVNLRCLSSASDRRVLQHLTLRCVLQGRHTRQGFLVLSPMPHYLETDTATRCAISTDLLIALTVVNTANAEVRAAYIT